jgi:RNA polymerase sigma factor (sigma-70 family)
VATRSTPRRIETGIATAERAHAEPPPRADRTFVEQPFEVTKRYSDMHDDFAGQFDHLYRVGYRASYTVLGNRADAEDCAQEAAARALVRWRTVSSHATPWVARVSTNLAIDRVRRLARQSAQPAPTDTATDPMSDRRRDLTAVLITLPKRQREAVAMRYLADLSEADTAKAMGCKVGTVKSATARGLARLRTELGPQWAWED